MKKWLFCLPVVFSVFIARSQQESSFSLGKKQYQEDNYAEALKYFGKAAEEEPQNPQVPYFTGRIYLDMSKYKESAVYLEKAIAMDSSRSNWIYECGLVYYAIPNYPKSAQFMELAAEKGYKRTNDYLENLGNVYVQLKQYDKSLELFKEVLKKKPMDTELLFQVAQTAYRAEKYQEAIDYWDQVLTQDKTNAEALYMIGLSYQKKGDTQKGKQLCDKAIEMNPSLRSKRQQLGGGAL